MATTYVVLHVIDGAAEESDDESYTIVNSVDAPNAPTACRRVAEGMADKHLDAGVTLIAVPARNWNTGRHTLKAETQRRIRST